MTDMELITKAMQHKILYIYPQLAGKPVSTTQFILGAATVRRRGIGTGAGRSTSFFIAGSATQTASSSPNVTETPTVSNQPRLVQASANVGSALLLTSFFGSFQKFLLRHRVRVFGQLPPNELFIRSSRERVTDMSMNRFLLHTLFCSFHFPNGILPRDGPGNFTHILPSHLVNRFPGNLIDHSSLFRCRLHWLLRLGERLSYFPDNLITQSYQKRSGI